MTTATQPRILLIAGPDAGEQIATCLAQAGIQASLETITDAAQIEAARSKTVELIVCVGVGKLGALEVCTALGQRAGEPLIVVDRQFSAERMRQAIALGVRDYVSVDRLEQLPLAIGRELQVSALKEELRRAKAASARALAGYQQRALHMEVIRQQNEDLDRLAADLAEAKHNLEIRAREAEETARLKAEFLANFSHEIRTPLNGIIGYCDLLMREEGGRLTPHGRRDLNVVKSNARTLLALINDILDLSKIEAGQMQAVVEQVDLESLADECAATVREYLKGKSVELNVNLDPATRLLRTDGLKLRQIVLNLLSNAAKFTENGEVVLATKAAGKDLILSVEDTGVGIPDDQVPFIFEKFRQVDGSTTRKVGGTGLGLAIVQELSKLMGGSISVRSTLGRGTAFTVVLRGVLDQEVHPLPQGQNQGTPPEAQPILQREGIVLLVDDDPLIQQLVRGQLEVEKFRVEIASDGVTALKMARELKPDAILLDIHLPRLDGWSVLAQLKSDPVLAPTPVILMSVEEQRARGFSLGAREYLVKPVEPDRLLSVIQKHLGTASGEVLIVDDDASTRELVMRSLRRAGISSVEARTGEEAVLRARISPPALVVLDLMMPTLDGFEVLRRLRADHGSIPVVVLTGKTLTPDEQFILREGLASYVQKGGHAIEDVVAQAKKVLVEQRAVSGQRRARILYVEDSPQNRDLVRRFLYPEFEVLEAEDGEHGVERAKRDEVDLILMDLSLPRMDGWEATRRIRALTASTPIIALTAHAGREYQDKALAAGCNDYMTKPIEREQLLDTVRKHLAERA